MITIQIQESDFDHNYVYHQLRQAAPGAGAIVTFTGLVREFSEQGDIQHMELECYPAMAKTTLQKIITEASNRWNILACMVIHRTGILHAHEQIVFVGSAAHHRQAAFDSASFVMDYLKTEAPFWKKEVSSNGTHWVIAKASDQQARKKWVK
ncbi:molybdenum cofactor biosynthesis protein MoaE [Zooshikella harenae]|uniref:Molybdopterin synthase catalytic subunit n=1 Tax=Zooshikella harenae TaxID=2827238 RepID=A0ABS5ZDV0_9GAMM|nr:molybdenum cofactor biosynthesis protein MoaE [Zooshikella harenae]MBU2712249.1 molybdenum cofactor biosynthesis protein MoaE [Zooshikella harenae]